MFDIKMEIVFQQNNNIQYTHACVSLCWRPWTL